GMPQWGYHADFYETADKTELTRAIAKSSAEAQLRISNALKKMKQTAAYLPATQDEVDTALSDYNTVLELNPIIGDVDQNGRISIMDAIMIQKAVLSVSELSGVQTLIADCNGDGEVSVLDAILVQKSALSIEATA
ncbi:MAG: dockerin type I repeat-containing protein, partial [Acutalibacteraceae bacterium]